MKVFTNTVEWFIAQDRSHLEQLYLAYCGETLEESEAYGYEWVEVPDDKAISIVDEDTKQVTSKTAKEWALEDFPTGLLCSTEY